MEHELKKDLARTKKIQINKVNGFFIKNPKLTLKEASKILGVPIDFINKYKKL